MSDRTGLDGSNEAVDLDAIEARAHAATAGPWNWRGNVDTQHIRLQSEGAGIWRQTVMDFVRWGMRDAAPRFNRDGLMDRADEMVQFEVCHLAKDRADQRVYRGDIDAVLHPDAEFIAHARTDVPALVAAVRTLRAERDEWHEEFDSLFGNHQALGADLVIEGNRRDAAEAALTEAQRGLEITDAELAGTRKRAERAEARLAEVEAERENWRRAASRHEADRALAHECRRAAEAQLAAVRELHRPKMMTFYIDSDCLEQACDHINIGPCPLVEQQVCAECFKTGDSQSEWETSVSDAVMWPCATATASADWPEGREFTAALAAVPGLLETHSKPDLSSSGTDDGIDYAVDVERSAPSSLPGPVTQQEER